MQQQILNSIGKKWWYPTKVIYTSKAAFVVWGRTVISKVHKRWLVRRGINKYCLQTGRRWLTDTAKHRCTCPRHGIPTLDRHSKSVYIKRTHPWRKNMWAGASNPHRHPNLYPQPPDAHKHSRKVSKTIVFPLFDSIITDQRTDWRTDGRTDGRAKPFIELLVRN